MTIFKYCSGYQFVLLFLGIMGGLLFSADYISKEIELPKVVAVDGDSFDGNRVRADVENNGMIVSHRISGHAGLEWPKENHTYMIYSSSVIVTGLVGGDLRACASTHNPERAPGSYGGDKNLPEFKLYKINQSDWVNPIYYDDFQNWPVKQGAPWVDEDHDGIYNPLPEGPDYPDLHGDQMIWFVSNDGDSAVHVNCNTDPLGLEFRTTVFGYNESTALGDMLFVKEQIFNCGGQLIEDMYISIWVDPDIGDANDDFVGCDTTLNLGICYNDGGDTDYAGYSMGTPAVGYILLQGPLVPSPGDKAVAFGRERNDYRNLPMTSFSKYLNANDAVWGKYSTVQELYYQAQGLMKDGSFMPIEMSGGTRYAHPGDPTLDSGPADQQLVDFDIHASNDRLFMLNCGPLTMAPGDSQEVIFCILLAADGDALNSYLKIKDIAEIAQNKYDSFPVQPAKVEPEIPLPTYITLYDNYPNPFNNFTIIKYFLPEDKLVEIAIFDLQGHQAIKLVDSVQPMGINTVKWSGDNDAGQAVATGIYFYQIHTTAITETKKLIYLK